MWNLPNTLWSISFQIVGMVCISLLTMPTDLVIFLFVTYTDVSPISLGLILYHIHSCHELLASLNFNGFITSNVVENVTEAFFVDADPNQREKRPSYDQIMNLANQIEIPDDFFDKMTYLERERAKDMENLMRIGASTDDEFIANKTFFKMQLAYQMLVPETESEKLFEKFNNPIPSRDYEINYTNKINVKGVIHDVSGWDKGEILHFLLPLTPDEANDLYFTEHVQTLFHVSTPTVKLYYPEPYIAAPSRIHTDLWILHIIHYQFWLWFFFIFIIVFFFLVFIISVRWNQNHVKPRRETRGVSRSKCGDLITACVPVSWAASIIISETTDAIDVQDGFSTSELVVGVRAYQWGWEYYYPKTIDLNYNVKPTYADFIGNSVRYSSTSDLVNNSNHFWRHYQKKQLNSSTTPMHLLVLPFDNKNVANFLNFNNVGVNTLQQSAAFAKIRANSKLFNTNVVTNSDQFSLKYARINELLADTNSYSNTTNYNNIRQLNLTSLQATNNNLSTFLNTTEMADFLSNSNDAVADSTVNLTQVNNFNSIEYFSLLNKYSTRFGAFLTQLNTINDNNDTKHVKNTLNSILTRGVLTKGDSRVMVNTTSGMFVPSSNLKTPIYLNLLNSNLSYLKTGLKGENNTILASDQLVRNYSNLKLGSSDFNFSVYNNPLSAVWESKQNTTIVTNTLLNSSLPLHYVIDNQFFKKLWEKRMSFGYPHPVFYSNNPFVSIFNYDTNIDTKHYTNLTKNRIKLETVKTPTYSNPILLGDQANAASNLSTAYWRMLWAGTDAKHRISSNFRNISVENNFYLPLFTNYYDYDFRSAQAIELLEDAYWESSQSSYNLYDYLNITRDVVKQPLNTKTDIMNTQNYLNTNICFDNNITNLINTNHLNWCNLLTNKLVYKDVSLAGQFYTNTIDTDDFIPQAQLTSTKNFVIFPTIETLATQDEAINFYKNVQKVSNNILNTTTLNNVFSNNTSSYLSVFNHFRSNFEDFTLTNLEKTNNYFTSNQVIMTDDLKHTQASDALILRGGVKNSIVTFNALRKVFRARFDEGRSHTSLQLFSNSYLNQPFLNDSNITYQQLLSKNLNLFYKNLFYKNVQFKTFTNSDTFTVSQNYGFYDLPFLTSETSDAQKFMWFDWWAQWGMYEVQPSSVAKYSTLGVPYSRKHFDFGAGQGDVIQDVETYFIRIARSRKNYLPHWLYSPHCLNRLLTFDTLFAENNSNAVVKLKLLLKNMYWFNNTLTFTDSSSERFTPSISGYNLYAKTSWRPVSGIQAYFAKNSQLLDILTRREFLYRKYLQTNKRLISLPTYCTVNKKNSLINEVKSAFLLSNPTTYSSEASRDFFYASSQFFKFILFKPLLINVISTLDNTNYLPINTSLITEYLFFYAMGVNSNKLGFNDLLYKDQHRPLKKNITSMLRLHGTGAIALPVDVRLQILASSRDVIHSWAIPSAGIKIDCVPGYTSHRITTFTLTGIYWGQCMEICGRYHHWMPIVIYFMKRDLFFLWCTHFVFKSSKLSNWKITDKQYTEYVRLISYDKTSWLNELSRQL